MLVMKYTIVVAEKMHRKEELGVINWPGWDKPCLIAQVQMRIEDGWVPIGGASYGEHEAFSDKVWAQSMIKCDCEEE